MYRLDFTGHPVLVNCFIHGFIVIYEKQNLKKRAIASTDIIRMLNERKVCNNNICYILILKNSGKYTRLKTPNYKLKNVRFTFNCKSTDT